MNDISEKHPEVVKELMALHEDWKARHYPNSIPRATSLSSYMFPEADKSLAR